MEAGILGGVCVQKSGLAIANWLVQAGRVKAEMRMRDAWSFVVQKEL